MKNPFSARMPIIKRFSDLIGRQEAADQLETYLQDRMSVVVMGPEGIGKTSFMESFFSRERRLRMARDSRLLMVKTSFRSTLTGEQIYPHLADAIESSLRILYEVDPENADAILRDVESKRNFSSRLDDICAILRDWEYDVSIFIDDFENFTSSKSVEIGHHGVMRSLIKAHHASYVVATNYDFNQDSLPPKVSGSFLLMEFSGNELILSSFTRDQCMQYLEAKGAGGCFTPDECDIMLDISGGIPALLRFVAEAAWEKKQLTQQLSNPDWDEICRTVGADPDVKQYLADWCRVITPSHMEVINRLLNRENRMGLIQSDNLSAAVKSLLNRGLLMPRHRNGQVLKDCYIFNSELLENYCRNTVLTVSDPHDVQKDNMIKELLQMVETGHQSEVLALMQEICKCMDNVTIPINYDEPLTNEILQQFELNEDILRRLDPFVRDEITTGIYIERTFVQVVFKDYTPVYISFAKAVEAHLNKLLVPYLKRIIPHYVVPGKSGNLQHTNDSLMLGQIHKILSFQPSALQTSVCKDAAKYCADLGCTEFNEQWWDTLTTDLFYIKDLRNDMPHAKPLSSDSGADLLRRLFRGADSFMMRITHLHEVMATAGITVVQEPVRAGTIVMGTVKSITRTEALIDIGAKRFGHLRSTQVRYGTGIDMLQEFQVDQQIQVKILHIDTITWEIELTQKDLPPV